MSFPRWSKPWRTTRTRSGTVRLLDGLVSVDDAVTMMSAALTLSCCCLLQGRAEQGRPDRDPAADEGVRCPHVVTGENSQHPWGMMNCYLCDDMSQFDFLLLNLTRFGFPLGFYWLNSSALLWSHQLLTASCPPSSAGDPRLHRVFLVPPSVDSWQQEAVWGGGAGSLQGYSVFTEERGA